MAENWIPDSCTLTPPEQSQRLIEFDNLFSEATACERVTPQALKFTLPSGREADARDLAERETQCCSFFTFEFLAGEQLELRVIVQPEYVKILDTIESRVAMNHLIKKFQDAMTVAEQDKPKVGGFPFLAESLRQAGAVTNTWNLPGCQCIFELKGGDIAIQGEPLVTGWVAVPPFDEAGLVAAIRKDQAGESTFPEFLQAAWVAGVTSYVVDFEARTVTYYGSGGQNYCENYPAVSTQ